ncbi:MAG TPA: hypothetical protein VF184_00045 [Phycisphaeraceae bacterium]
MSSRSVAGWMLAAWMGLAAVGCSTPYVNIPAAQGDVASHNPNADNVRGVQIAALRAVLLDRPIEGPIKLVLPEGTSNLTYAAVAEAVGPNAYAPFEPEADDATATLEVKQIRIRGWQGEVDLVRPYPYGQGEVQQLVTVYLDYAPFSGWTFNRIRSWRSGTQAALPSEEVRPGPVEAP